MEFEDGGKILQGGKGVHILDPFVKKLFTDEYLGTGTTSS